LYACALLVLQMLAFQFLNIDTYMTEEFSKSEQSVQVRAHVHQMQLAIFFEALVKDFEHGTTWFDLNNIVAEAVVAAVCSLPSPLILITRASLGAPSLWQVSKFT
jgi:hypothetical protein